MENNTSHRAVNRLGTCNDNSPTLPHTLLNAVAPKAGRIAVYDGIQYDTT